MSSPNHPTFDNKDAFSSNFSDYIPASPDYFLASPGNTSSKSSNNSSGLVLIASPTLSLFHDDPYMKVMHAYNAIIPPQIPILSPIIMPPSPMLSPMFDPQDLFRPKEILPPKKRGHARLSSSTSALPQAFEMGESSYKTSLEHHEEQIEDILNHLDELSRPYRAYGRQNRRSWKRYIRGKPLGKLIWNSIQNGPSPHPMVTDAPSDSQTGVNMPRMKLDSEFTPKETNRENADTSYFQQDFTAKEGRPI
ncbi:hypothetical protein Tco_1310942 [Tanacetum coccineum]